MVYERDPQDPAVSRIPSLTEETSKRRGVNNSVRQSAPETARIRFTTPLLISLEAADGNWTAQTPAESSLLTATEYKLLVQVTRPGADLLAKGSLEIRAAQPETRSFLEGDKIPLGLHDSDLDFLAAGGLLTKVVYLPKAQTQVRPEVTEVVTSARLDPAGDAVAEANRRGTVLAVLRLSARAAHSGIGGAKYFVRLKAEERVVDQGDKEQLIPTIMINGSMTVEQGKPGEWVAFNERPVLLPGAGDKDQAAPLRVDRLGWRVRVKMLSLCDTEATVDLELEETVAEDAVTTRSQKKRTLQRVTFGKPVRIFTDKEKSRSLEMTVERIDPENEPGAPIRRGEGS